VELDEDQVFYGNIKQPLRTVIENPSIDPITEQKNCKYILNFNDSTSTFYRNDQFVSKVNFTIKSQKDSQILFLDNKTNGLIVKEDMSEITFFKVTDDLVTYKYFTKFTSNIIKN
jgi:hypothetical protein